MTLYDHSFPKLTGEQVENLAKYRDQVLLIVNTASKCGFTPQYEGLESLYEKYKERGFTVLGFPSDSFLKQEFSESEKTAEFCKVNYGVTFPLFKMSKMKGREMNPLFQELLQQADEKKISWNFNKFLVNRSGHVYRYYGSKIKPEAIKSDIELLLNE